MWLHKELDFSDTRARLNDEGFAVKECILANKTCWLIFPPHAGVEWNKDNVIYRSSIWDNEGYPVSLSWKKFFNWDERCDISPKPASLDECRLINKEDGSTLIVSVYNGEFIIRTRGSSDISLLDNGYEKEFLLKKYSKFFNSIPIGDAYEYYSSSVSWVFEWVTPNNKIILDYGDEPKLILTGIINHSDYSYSPRYDLEYLAKFYDLDIPVEYNFDSIDAMQRAMKELKGIEGICVYFNDYQDIKKVKTSEYLMLHSLKFKLGYKALIDMIFEENLDINKFKNYIERKFDHEGLKYIENLIDDIYYAINQLTDAISWLYEESMIQLNERIDKSTVELNERKEFADIVINELKIKKTAGFMFKMYEAKTDDVNQVINDNASLKKTFKDKILETVTAK